MSTLVVTEELITTSGALSLYHAAVDELERRYGGSDEAQHLRVDELLPPSGVFLVARRDGHPIGGVGVRTIGEPALRFGEIKRLWVRPDQRRGGVGIQLMTRAEVRARELGFTRIYLETGYAQPEALALYEASAWQRIDVFPEGAFSYPGAYRFEKAL